MKQQQASRNPHGILWVEGECIRPQHFSFLDLAEVHRYYQVPDVSKVDERYTGRAVRLRKLIDLVGPGNDARWITAESEDGKFSVCLPLEEVAPTALVIYGVGDKALDRSEGGPARYLVPFHPDNCTAVKGLARLVISCEQGRDTRPSTKEEHVELHRQETAD